MNTADKIIDIDSGSCRDINFPDSNSLKAISLIKYINGSNVLLKATNSEGATLSAKDILESLKSSEKQSIHTIWESKNLISNLQIFFSWRERTKISIEITFFPKDINIKLYSLNNFNDWLKPILISLDTNIFYVRYENASWEYGDTSKDSGVIYTNNEHKING